MADINSIVLPDGTEYPISDYYLPVSISNPTGGQVLKYDAVNQIWYNGEDASGSSILYGTSAPTSQLGVNGNLYVKYTEGTGGASDTVDALYVKLDGDWCQISTGGGGSSSFSGLDDVDLTNLQNGQLAKYDSTTQKWKNVTLQESDVSGLTDDLDTLGGGENIVDKVPYISRISGGDINSSDINIGNRELDKIVGGTFAFNQLVNTFSDYTVTAAPQTPEGSMYYVNISTNILGGTNTLIVGHKYFVLLKTADPSSNFVKTNLYFNSYQKIVQVNGVGLSATIINATGTSHLFRGYSSNTAQISFKVNILVVDLTQMFGSTIADYIYTLEQTTAGAGVSWFRNLFPKDYYAYNSGELMSVKTSAHKMIGKNLLSFSTTTITSQTTIINNLFLKSGDYTFSIDVNNTTNIAGVFTVRIGTTALATAGFEGKYQGRITKSFTLSQDSIINIVLGGASAGYSFTVSNAQIEFGSTATTYEPYFENNYTLDANLELRGIPRLDTNNKLYYDGDEYTSDGNVKRKYGIVDLGGLSWNDGEQMGGYTRYAATVSDNLGYRLNTIYYNLICSKIFTVSDKPVTDNSQDKAIVGYGWSDGHMKVFVRYDACSSKAELISALSGVYLVFGYATPTNESALPYQNPQIVDDLGTEEYIDSRTVPIPVGHETTYLRNLKEKLKNAPAIPVANGDYVLRKTNGGAEYVEFDADYAIQPVIYSEDERVIGVWTDGRPLYEKTIDHTFTSGAQSYTVFASGIGVAFAHTYMVEYSSNRWLSMDVISKANLNNMVSFQVERDTNGALIIGEVGSTARRWIAVIRYTKTADEPGSGSWTPQGVPAVHYSTSEKVIGTWIDGKALYEKTYTFTAPSSNTFTREDLGIPMSEIDNAWIDSQNTFATNSTMCTASTFYDGTPKADQFGCYLNFLQTNLALDYRVGSDFYSSDIVLTIRYTKSS